jgi:hypothetical protein
MTHNEFISDTLTHWTGRKKTDEEAAHILKAICEEEVLRLTHCPRYVQPDLKPCASMVCFTDVPLRFSAEHCGLFGRCGIGFRKDAMIAHGANPVLYTTSRHLARIQHIETLLATMRDFEKDRGWRKELEPYRFTEDETIALMEVIDFLQEYSYKNEDDKPYVTYYQREWRLPFNVLPFAGGTKLHEPGMSSFYIRDDVSYPIFRFATTDVAFLVVPRAVRDSVSDIARAKSWDLKLFEDEIGT